MNCLLWDFDGTLGYRAAGGWTDTLLAIARARAPGCPVTAEQIRPHLQSGFPWHTPERPHPHLRSAEEWWDAMDVLFERAFARVGFDPAPSETMARQVRRIYPDPACWRLYDDTLAALEGLSARGWTHVLLTNHVPELPDIIRHLGLEPHFVCILNSAQTGYEKPHPQAFRNALQAVGGVERVWMIGDSMPADIAGAAAAGIPGILVRKPHLDAHHYCTDLSQLDRFPELRAR